MRTVIYETAAPIRENERFVAFLTADNALLPVRFCASTALGAQNAANAFWQAEIAKKQASEVNTKATSERMKARGRK